MTGRFAAFLPHRDTETRLLPLKPPLKLPLQTNDKSFVDTPVPPRLLPENQTVRSELTLALTPDDQRTRGEGAEDAVVTITPQTSLLNLELPVTSDYAHSTFRVSLKRFMKNREILTAHSLAARPSKTGLMVVFPVAARFFAESGEYVLDLRSVNAGGKLEEVNTFTFEVARKSR
jgi:hypothetical protein